MGYRPNGFERRPHTQRYDLTDTGRRVTVLSTKTHARVLTPGLAATDLDVPDDIVARSPLDQSWRRVQRSLDASSTPVSPPRETTTELDRSLNLGFAWLILCGTAPDSVAEVRGH